jgi:PAS domain S-box-containing protein
MTTKIDIQSSISVLIIEDNPGDYLLVEDFLIEKFKGVKIIHRKDSESSTELLKDENANISVILLDLNLPDIKGIDLIEKMLSHSPHTPIIILTGYSDVNLAQKSLQLGVYDYLIKDEINPTLLHKSIEFAINRRRYVQQIEEEKTNYEKLFNFSPQPMWLLDYKTLNIRNANLSAIQKYGYPLDKLSNMSFLQLHPKEESVAIRQKIWSKQKGSGSNHFTHILNDGRKINVEIYCGEIKSYSNNDFVIVQSNDITETLNHINTIEVQNIKLRSIAWTQSHLVRAPLSRILSIINLIEDQKEDLDDLMFWLEQLKVSTHEMDEVVNKIVEETQRLK